MKRSLVGSYAAAAPYACSSLSSACSSTAKSNLLTGGGRSARSRVGNQRLLDSAAGFARSRYYTPYKCFEQVTLTEPMSCWHPSLTLIIQAP